MLKKEVINLLNENEVNFKNIFSICIGKSFLHQSRFIDYIGKYNRWDTSIKEGILKLDDKIFNVDYIGTTSVTDNYWYSSELEDAIPDQYVRFMMETRKLLESLNLAELAQGKIMLNGDINGYNLSMIYIAFAPENVTYFCGSGGNAQIYMFVKNLPDVILKKINSIEFTSYVMQIISTFNVNHKLLVKALLIENEITYESNQNNIIVKFDENSILTVQFNEKELIKNISGNLANNGISKNESVQPVVNSKVEGNNILNVEYNRKNENIKKIDSFSYALYGFICSLVGLIIFGFPMGFAAISLAMSAKKEMKTSGNAKGNGLAIVAIIIGIIDIIGVMFGIIMR